MTEQDHTLGPLLLDDDVIADMERRPQAWAPRHPYYRQNPANTNLTVRQWFRMMRATDFERAVKLKTASLQGVFFIVQPALQSWTLLDTQRVVDREIAVHYVPPK